jgi:hypothetical protein
MQLVQQILGFLLGAGKGWIGTVIRAGLVSFGTYLASKGFLDQDTAVNLVDQIMGVVLTILAVVGSRLNDKVQLEKTPPKK